MLFAQCLTLIWICNRPAVAPGPPRASLKQDKVYSQRAAPRGRHVYYTHHNNILQSRRHNKLTILNRGLNYVCPVGDLKNYLNLNVYHPGSMNEFALHNYLVLWFYIVWHVRNACGMPLIKSAHPPRNMCQTNFNQTEPQENIIWISPSLHLNEKHFILLVSWFNARKVSTDEQCIFCILFRLSDPSEESSYCKHTVWKSEKTLGWKNPHWR